MLPSEIVPETVDAGEDAVVYAHRIGLERHVHLAFDELTGLHRQLGIDPHVVRFDDLGEGGGYVLNFVHNIQDEVPPENVCMMFEAAMEYGVY